ncbi:MAG TPA: c-type cytochrome [Chitinophagaceae bacterium]|nr:c-type cytochrome [Chitinophagaceae bacterium]
MISKQQFVTFLCIALFVFTGIAATRLPQKNERNLKVLPKDISDQALDSFMHSYNKALGVGCDFCHSQDKNPANGLNFELDDNPMKEEARKMMRLTIQLNKDYFYFDSTRRPEYLNVVACITCHRGDPMPADLK